MDVSGKQRVSVRGDEMSCQGEEYPCMWTFDCIFRFYVYYDEGGKAEGKAEEINGFNADFETELNRWIFIIVKFGKFLNVMSTNTKYH